MRIKVYKTSHVPSKWEGIGPDRERIDILYSRGTLIANVNNKPVFRKHLGVDASFLDTQEMKIWLGHLFSFEKV